MPKKIYMPGEIYNNQQLIVERAVKDTYNKEHPHWSDKVLNGIHTLFNGHDASWWKERGMEKPVGELGVAGMVNPTAEKLKKVLEFTKDTKARMAAQGHTFEHVPKSLNIRKYDPNTSFHDAHFSNPEAVAYFSPLANDVTTKEELSKVSYKTLNHEINGHWLRNNANPNYKPLTRQEMEQAAKQLYEKEGDVVLKSFYIPKGEELFTPYEKDMLLNAYGDVFSYGPGKSNLHEMGAVNTELRAGASERNGHVLNKKLNDVIDKEGGDILNDLLTNGYTHPGVAGKIAKATGKTFEEAKRMTASELQKAYESSPALQDFVRVIKNAMKAVGAVSAITVAQEFLYKEPNNPFYVNGYIPDVNIEETHKFKQGGFITRAKSGIHIKPKNKGKFTETKKRTGKTTEELTHSKNPITRKRAIFAQNAKKWNKK